MRILAIVIALFITTAGVAQVPAPGETKESILLLNGYAHLGNGEVIENSFIIIKGQQIVEVGNAKTVRLDQTKFKEVVNCAGKHIYPGFILPNSKLGLTEIEAVRASNDFDDVGEFNPHVRSLTAYNSDSRVVSTVRTNGVLMAQVTPKGGRISGTSSVMNLDGWNWEDAALIEEDGVFLNWPNKFRRTGWWAEPGEIKKNENYQAQMDRLTKFFESAKAYEKQDDQVKKNLRWEAMRGVFTGEKRLYIRANDARSITRAVLFAKQHKVVHVVIVGGIQSYHVKDLLKENNVAVMIQRTHALPDKEDDDIDNPFKLAKRLKDAGVKYCLQNAGDMEAMNSRNLPFLAGTTVAYGVSKEDAVSSITLSTAQIMGIDKWVGSLENGKLATLFVSEGDALDMMTNNVVKAYVAGKEIDLNNPQKELYKKFQQKYEDQKNTTKEETIKK